MTDLPHPCCRDGDTRPRSPPNGWAARSARIARFDAAKEGFPFLAYFLPESNEEPAINLPGEAAFAYFKITPVNAIFVESPGSVTLRH